MDRFCASSLSLHGSTTWPKPHAAPEANELPRSAPAALSFAVARADCDEEYSFDLPKWRVECEAELQKMRARSAKRPPKRRNSAWAQLKPVSSGRAPTVLLPVLPADERARISEAIFSQQDELSHAVCRGNTAAVLAVRASCAVESARERQRRYRELGEEHRWQAVQWREQHRRRQQVATLEHDGPLSGKGTKPHDNGAQITSGDSNRGSDEFHGLKRTSAGERVERTASGQLRSDKMAHFRNEVMRRINKRRTLEEDHLDLEEAFNFFTVRGTSLVPGDRLLRLLLELGLSGSCKQERCAIKQLCSSGELTSLASENAEGNHGNQVEGPAASTSALRRVKPGVSVGTAATPAVHFGNTEEFDASRNSGEVRPQISFNSFRTAILPEVRCNLSEMRQEQHFNFYMRLLNQLPPETAGLTQDAFLKAVHTLGVDMNGAKSALASFNAQPASAGRGGLIDAEAFHELIMVADERAHRKRRREEREIQAKLELPEDTFWDHRFELFRLHQTYLTYDANSNGFLDGDEVKQMLKHLGFEPYRDSSSKVVNALIAEFDDNRDEMLSFCEFLMLMKRIRGLQRSERRQLLEKVFKTHMHSPKRSSLGQRETTYDLDTRTILSVLVELGVQVDKAGSTEAVAKRALEDFEMEYFGDVRFAEFERLIQRILEALASRIAEQCGNEASDLGLAKEAVANYQWAFDQLDTDCSNSLSFSESWEAVQMNAGRTITEGEMVALYREVGIDIEDDLDIFNFMRLMKLASEQIFRVEHEFKLDDVSPKRLRECLMCFPLSKSFVACVAEDDLPEMVASYCDIARDANLKTLAPTPIINVRQLLEHARRKASADHAVEAAIDGNHDQVEWG